MAQCRGTTKKGDQCRREARDKSGFCSIHQDQEVRARTAREGAEWDKEALMKAALGFGLVAAIVLFRFRR